MNSAAKRLLRVAGYLIGLALIVSAVAVAVQRVDFTLLRAARPWQVGLLAAAVAGNLLLTSWLITVITRSFDAQPAVGLGRMLQLVSASALLNYLPLQPGLLGRAAYLKLRHALPLRQSMLILAIVFGLGALVLAGAAVLVTLAPPDRQLTFGLSLTLAAAVLAGPVMRRLLRRPVVQPWLWAPLRVADLFVAALRFWLAMQILGAQVSFSWAVLAAAAGMFVSLLPLTPNGLGLREWVIAAIAPVWEVGLAASVVDRAVEAVVVSGAGLLGLPALRADRTAGP